MAEVPWDKEQGICGLKIIWFGLSPGGNFTMKTTLSGGLKS